MGFSNLFGCCFMVKGFVLDFFIDLLSNMSFVIIVSCGILGYLEIC